MIPLFWISEKIQDKDKKKKQAMKEDLKKLEDVSNPQEKHFYTMEIYRIHQYHPAQSLVGLLGLCIQIPFFIAAYRMLDHYTPLSGVSFGPIPDLFQPDGLFFDINILPFLMTGINLISGYFYSRDMDKNEKLQLAAVSMLFLFLLYNKPSAMVLYWTMNNLLAIGKNWLLGHPPHLPQLKRPAWLDRLKSMDLKPFRIWLMILPGIIFLIPAVLLPEKYMVLKRSMAILLEIQLALTAIVFFKRFYFKDRNWFLGLITVGSFSIHFLLFTKHLSYKMSMFLILSQIPLLLVQFLYIAVEPLKEILEKQFEQHPRIYNRMLILGSILFSALVCLYSPLTLYRSDPGSMIFPLGSLVLWHLLYSLILIGFFWFFIIFHLKG